MSQSTSITNKVYKRLVIQVSLQGLSYAVQDTITNQYSNFDTITIGKINATQPIEEVFSEVFNSHEALQSSYDDVMVIHSNTMNTFVPSALFDEDYKGSYLQFSTKVYETDFFAHDTLERYEINNVFIPYVNMNNYFIDQYGSFDYKHANSILVEKLLDLSKNSFERKMYIHVDAVHFEIVVIRNQQLEFFNSFEYKTPEDFIYYILFTAEQLHLNPENFQAILLGKISEDSPFYEIAYRYIRNISLLEVTPTSSIEQEKYREHFILFNA